MLGAKHGSLKRSNPAKHKRNNIHHNEKMFAITSLPYFQSTKGHVFVLVFVHLTARGLVLGHNLSELNFQRIKIPSNEFLSQNLHKK